MYIFNVELCCLYVLTNIIIDNFLQFRALFGAVLHDGGKGEAEEENEDGLFPLHIAAKNLLTDAVWYLLSYGVDVNQKSNAGERTALHYAVRFWQPDKGKQKQQMALVQVLVAFKADHSLQDAGGHVPLFNAIVTEDIELVELLIEHAPIDHQDVDGDTHLHTAAAYSLDDIADLLIRRGANPELCNNEKQTPLHIAAQKSDTCLIAMSDASIKYSKGPEIVDVFSEEDGSRRTPLDYAAIHSHRKTFHYMWEHIQKHPRPGITSYKPVLDRLFHENAEKIRFAILQQTLEQQSKPE